MSVPSVGQAQAAQPPAPEPARSPTPPTADPQEAVARAAATPAPAPDTTTAPIPPVKADTRVVVRTNSWVELRAPNGDILAQTYVRAGESYTVPAGISYKIINAR